jgi:putative nucleotidyltransferase with HDIG domain/PAS domain S-box-containing protein
LTKKKKHRYAKNALQLNPEGCIDILKGLPDIVYKIDPDGCFTFINDSVRNLGYKPEELIGKHFSKIIHPDDVKLFTRNYVLPKFRGKDTGNKIAPKLFDERRTGKRETKGLCIRLIPNQQNSEKKDAGETIGSVIIFGDVSSRGHYETDTDKKEIKFLGTLGVIKDVTERKRAEDALQRSLNKLERILEETVNALASAVETRDPYTAGHQRRVANLASTLAREMGLSKEQINGIHMAAVIHDIGKIHVPAEILSKPTRLTDAEFDIVKTHAQVGYDILKSIEFPWPIADVIRQHHERMNGSGYPQGLKKGDILLEAGILAVADVVEAMSSYRPYRPARSWGETFDEITKNRVILYEPHAVDVCLELFKKKNFKFE